MCRVLVKSSGLTVYCRSWYEGGVAVLIAAYRRDRPSSIHRIGSADIQYRTGAQVGTA